MTLTKPAFGKHLNHIPSSAYPCPECFRAEALDIYEHVAVWACGFVRPLPPVRQPRWMSASRTRKARA
ncbi:hypothetical protein ACFORH_42770 [Amycolatopsis roodepoortensis]|uniref:Uncharacterized protein n=1 Tax=Amycolatopsis roodepoortensis TaxID=700274 RepID=A0ABR9L3A2_9PSEU|nr:MULTISPECIES: hypothetical protein [Amycolatopsis]MBE1575032.1 hypothetical protein [Amycolatopsis roodepoortensis]GHG97396.1 hypothetical protein GCM10017788_76870 [Amycolatopsis acidiphila]